MTANTIIETQFQGEKYFCKAVYVVQNFSLLIKQQKEQWCAYLTSTEYKYLTQKKRGGEFKIYPVSYYWE